MSSPADSSLRVIHWNVEWASRRSVRGRQIREKIISLRPDVVCLTEAHADFLSDGHLIVSDPDYGYGDQRTKRKVVLWSAAPWRDVSLSAEHPLPGGRFVAGTTSTPVGDIRFVGVCIPWKDAHVRTGRRDRQPWEDHLRFLEELPNVLGRDTRERMVLLGDFNQTIPRTRAPQQCFDRLAAVLADFEQPTAGPIDDAPEPAIDHICHSRDLACVSLRTLSHLDDAGQRLSDHFGLGADLRVKVTDHAS